MPPVREKNSSRELRFDISIFKIVKYVRKPLVYAMYVPSTVYSIGEILLNKYKCLLLLYDIFFHAVDSHIIKLEEYFV